MQRLAILLPLFAVALPLAACGHDQPPPLTGNLTDARGAHAGSFRAPDDGTRDYGNAAGRIEPGATNTQGATDATTQGNTQ